MEKEPQTGTSREYSSTYYQLNRAALVARAKLSRDTLKLPLAEQENFLLAGIERLPPLRFTGGNALSKRLLAAAAGYPAVLYFAIQELHRLVEQRKEKNRRHQQNWVTANPDKVKAKREKEGRSPPDPAKWPPEVWKFFSDRLFAESTQEVAEDARLEAVRARRALLATMTPKERKKEVRRKWKQRPETKIVEALRDRVRNLVKKRGIEKADTTMSLTGCSANELRVHLENQFSPDMSWGNYGTFWEIDHVIPCASFDLRQPEAQRQCFHFSNLQPLTAEDNNRKGARHVRSA